MPFNDLQDFSDPALRLPIRGKVYVVPSPDWRTGLWCQRLLTTATTAIAGVEITEQDVASLELDDDAEQELYQRVLGPVWDEMAADGLPWEWIKHAGTTTFLWIASSRDDAESFWNNAPGEALGPSRSSASAAKKSARPVSRASSKPRTATPGSASPTSSGPVGR